MVVGCINEVVGLTKFSDKKITNHFLGWNKLVVKTTWSVVLTGSS